MLSQYTDQNYTIKIPRNKFEKIIYEIKKVEEQNGR